MNHKDNHLSKHFIIFKIFSFDSHSYLFRHNYLILSEKTYICIHNRLLIIP